MSLPENLVCNIIARNADKFVTVSFIAKDGNERTYNGRFNVKKYYKGTPKSEVVSEMLQKQNLIPIWTKAEDGSYSKVKSFRPNTVTRIVAGGRQVFNL